MADSDSDSAKTLTLVAIILQIVFLIAGVAIIASVLAIGFNSIPNGTSPGTSFVASEIISLVFGVIFLIGALWIILDYVLIYAPLSRDEVSRAESPALVLAILQLIFGGIITGILLLVAWVKIKDSLRNSRNMPPAAQ